MIRTSLIAIAALTGAAFAQKNAEVGQQVPDFTFGKIRNGDGRQKLSEFRGQVVMLEFWGTH